MIELGQNNNEHNPGYKINLEEVEMNYKSPVGQEQQLLTPN